MSPALLDKTAERCARATSASIGFIPDFSEDKRDLWLEGLTLSANVFLKTDFAWPHNELLEGQVRMVPPSEFQHQRVQSRLMRALILALSKSGHGEVFDSHTGIRVGKDTFVMPDIIWYPADHPRLKSFDDRDATPPGLVVEILSPSNAEHDLVTKRALYADAGVPYYWIVNPMEKSLFALELKDGVYHTTGATKDGVFQAKPFEGLEVPTEEIFPWPDE